MKKLTELELKVVTALSYGDEFEDMPSACFEDLKDSAGVSNNVLKGVISSLDKKDMLMYGEYPNGLTCYHLSDSDFYNLTY